ncbi:hypothetical protein C0991_004807 [Blastosporella zonata]|nr:hypothetical protein C0991_004807 [Blastosporella zonata]
MISESKTDEFARLFDFFERLASHKSRSGTDGNKISVDDVDLPADLASVVNNLTNLIGTRNNKPNVVDEQDAELLANFPLGKKYTFTFRLMVHKLYQMEDWKQKVNDVLERSQIDYKPLSETPTVVENQKKVDEKEKQDGRVHFKVDNITGGSRKPAGRPRAHSVLVLGKVKDVGPLSPILKPLKSPVMKIPAFVEEDVRAIKKRCVGRRKSFSGPSTTEVGRLGGAWVYDAAVSSTEVCGVSEATNDQLGESVMRRKAHTGIGVAGPGKVEGRRRVSLRSGAPGVAGKLPDSEIAKRRRALSVMDNMAPAVQAQRKRRFEL